MIGRDSAATTASTVNIPFLLSLKSQKIIPEYDIMICPQIWQDLHYDPLIEITASTIILNPRK